MRLKFNLAVKERPEHLACLRDFASEELWHVCRDRGDVLSNRVSVVIVITSYELGRFLLQAIDSALAQKVAGVEVIVVDDGSKDESCRMKRWGGVQVVPE